MSNAPEPSTTSKSLKAAHLSPVLSDRLVLLGYEFWNPTFDQFWNWWIKTVTSSDRNNTIIALANANTLNIARTNAMASEALGACDLILNDGIGIRLGAMMRGVPVPYNFNGTDLIPRLCRDSSSKLRIFLLGGVEEANLRACEKLKELYPNVEIAGRLNGYVDKDLMATPAIAASGADLLLVCLGNPLQEIYLTQNRDKFNVKVAMGVGGLVDFLSQTKPRAPDWMRKLGIEWIFRLGLEPKRMAKRYILGNPMFLLRCAKMRAADKELQYNADNQVQSRA